MRVFDALPSVRGLSWRGRLSGILGCDRVNKKTAARRGSSSDRRPQKRAPPHWHCRPLLAPGRQVPGTVAAACAHPRGGKSANDTMPAKIA